MTSAHRECLVPIAQLTDELMAATKGDQPNLLVGIGFPGGMITFLNPTSAEDILARYPALQFRDLGSGDHVKLMAFNDVFDALEFGVVG